MRLLYAKSTFARGWFLGRSRLREIVNALPIMACLAVMFVVIPRMADAQEIQVGSKRFTESYVLGEIAKRLLEDAEFTVEHKQGMGGTIIVWRALINGDISMYPDYTGTIQETILKSRTPLTSQQMRAALAEHGIGMTEELGFNNTYAFAMRRETAESLNIRTISDLRNHPNLKLGLTHEFLNRNDGWEPLSKRYGLTMRPRGMEHSLTYVALNNGNIDLIDAYSTDAKLGEYELAVLEDDLEFFPKYNAVFLYRLDADPKAISAVGALGGTIDEARMIQLNVAAEQMKDYTRAADLYFQEAESGDDTVAKLSATSEMWRLYSKIAPLTVEHLTLVGISMLLAILIGIPLGIRASRPGLFSQFILGLTGTIQTIPSIVMLAILIPILGTNIRNAIAALFLYSLLPIVRNTAAGLQDISTPIRESAAALGLKPRSQLTKVYLPMASRSILAGVKTSTIINIGTATLAGFIGAGGYGEPIFSGINLNATDVILQGAIPAALLALLSQFLFDLLDRVVIPRGLRLKASA